VKPADEDGCQPGGGAVLRHLWQQLRALVLLLVVLLMGTLARRACPLVEPWITGPLSAEGDRVVDGVLGVVWTGFLAIGSHRVGREP
jgi:hypothetical protein